MQHVIFKIEWAKLPCLMFLCWFAFPSFTAAQFHETFDEGQPTWVWNRRDTDCVISKSRWIQKRDRDPKTNNRFEKIHFRCGHGTEIYVSHDIPPSLIIPELNPSLNLKSDRAGIRFFVRVVLPHTKAPNGEGEMTTMIPVATYGRAGYWETLKLSGSTSLKSKLRDTVWLLRSRYGSSVDDRDAYIDKVILNLYTAPGESTVHIDDLTVSGRIEPNKLANAEEKPEFESTIQQVGFMQDVEPAPEPERKRPSLVVRDGTVLLVKKQPFFPRIIQHNGEGFDFLKSLGFNTIELKSTASYEQLRQAKELDLWLISPPPKSVGLTAIPLHFDRVLAWTVGQNLTIRELETVQKTVREIRESDKREGRPIISHAANHWGHFADSTDVLGLGVQPIGTSFYASQYSDWIRQRVESTGNSKPVWADIQTELSRALTLQAKSITSRIPPVPVEPQQIKFLVYEAIAGGSRGLRFRSDSRLDSPDPLSRLRAQTLEWVTSELALIEPWALGGAWMGEIKTGDATLEVNAFSTNRSRLLLIQRPTHHEQYLAGDVPIKNISFADPNTTFANRVQLITESGLKALPNARSHAGTQINLENCGFTAAVVMTEDPLVINRINEGYERVGKKTILQLHRELTQQWLAICQLINGQLNRMERGSNASNGATQEAAQAFQLAETMIESGASEVAINHLKRADERLALARRELVTGPLGAFQSKTSSPFITHCSLIPLHWELAGRLANRQWNPNGLAGGDFEDLGHMKSNGWTNRRLDDELLTTKVELTPSAFVDGKYGIRLAVQPRNSAPSVVEAPPLWIATPEVPVKGGQLVRIHGWINVPRVIQGTHDGLTIYDSLGGPEMAERINITQGWQEFTLYRGVPSDTTLNVTFMLSGLGEAMLDEVTIRTLDLNETPRQAKNSPNE